MYTFIMVFTRGLRALINGKTTVIGQENLPKDGNYIITAPHRTFWDPVWHALAAYPKRFIFMSKKELFKPVFGAFIRSLGAFPVDRENPGPSAIKYPVKTLKSGERSLIVYPTGSRHSSELKAGQLLIARMSGAPLIPTVYQGPVKFMGLFKRNNTTVAFGKPIYITEKRLTPEDEQRYDQEIQNAFDALDRQIDPDWRYVDPHPKTK